MKTRTRRWILTTFTFFFGAAESIHGAFLEDGGYRLWLGGVLLGWSLLAVIVLATDEECTCSES